MLFKVNEPINKPKSADIIIVAKIPSQNEKWELIVSRAEVYAPTPKNAANAKFTIPVLPNWIFSPKAIIK